MRSYASISPMFWTRGSGKKLRGHKEAQIVALYLMTSPSIGLTGIFRTSVGQVSEDTGISQSWAEQQTDRIADLVRVDWVGGVAWSLETSEYHLGDCLKSGENRIIGALRELAQFGDHPFVSEFISINHDRYRLGDFPEVSPRKSGWSKVFYGDVYERDRQACRYCGGNSTLSVDHIVPRCQGGDDSLENLVVACRACNSKKGGRTPEQAGMVLV